MGTSTNYSAPTTPQWKDLKGDVTRSSGRETISNSAPRRILRKYVQASGGSRRISEGGGKGGRSRAAKQAAANLGNFSRSVSTTGLDEALRSYGLEHLIGRTAEDVLYGLVDSLCEDGSTLDEVDARQAMMDVCEQMLEGAESYDEVREILEDELQADSLGDLLQDFFASYIFHRFCRAFFEHISERHGEASAERMLGRIRRFISSSLNHHAVDRDLTRVKWDEAEGEAITQEIMQQTLEVFEH